jgi:hypothetical protein
MERPRLVRCRTTTEGALKLEVDTRRSTKPVSDDSFDSGQVCNSFSSVVRRATNVAPLRTSAVCGPAHCQDDPAAGRPWSTDCCPSGRNRIERCSRVSATSWIHRPRPARH